MKTTAPKRFLMMTTFFPPEHAGGDGVHVRRLCELLVSAGHEVSVLASSDAFKLKHLEAKVADQAPGLKVYRLRTSWPWMNAVLTHQTGLPVFYRAEIERVLEEVRPDVIHYHNISLLGGPGLLSLGKGVKICTLHDHWAVCPTHALFKFNRTPCREKQCLLCTLKAGRLPQIWRYGSLLQKSLREVDLILSPSEFTLERHKSDGLDFTGRVLPHFVPDTFRHSKPAAKEGDYLLYVGRLEHLKGIGWLAETLADRSDIKLVIAGDGALRPQLARMSESSPSIELLPWNSEEQLIELYSNALATVVPSLCYETFGLSLAESMSCGTPVIAHDVGVLGETVRASGGGLLYQDQSGFHQAVDLLKEDHRTRESLGEKAKNYAHEHWTEGRYLDEYLDIVESLLASHCPG